MDHLKVEKVFKSLMGRFSFCDFQNIQKRGLHHVLGCFSFRRNHAAQRSAGRTNVSQLQYVAMLSLSVL